MEVDWDEELRGPASELGAQLNEELRDRGARGPEQASDLGLGIALAQAGPNLARDRLPRGESIVDSGNNAVVQWNELVRLSG